MSSPKRDQTVQQAMLTILKYGTILTLVIAGAGALIGGFVAGWPGVWGALLGAGMAGVFFALTALSVYISAEMSATAMAGLILGAFLVKMIALIAVTALLRGSELFDPVVLFVTLAVAAIASVVVDAVVIQRSRIPNVDPKFT